MKTCFLTGATGFLGSHILPLLLAEGWRVRALARNPSALPRHDRLETIPGTLTDPATISSALEGCDAALHVAAKAGVWGSYRSFYEPNVLGTRNLLAGVRQHRVPLLVHTSTPSVVYNGQPLRGADESLPLGTHFPCHYAATKAMAEREILAAADPRTLRVCALRPHLVWGVGDPHLLPRVRERAAAGKLRIVGDGTNRVDITHVANAARAHLQALQALEAGRACGRAYFLSQGEPVALWPWLNAYLERTGVPPIRRRIGLPQAYLAGLVGEIIWTLLRRPDPPPMTRFVAVELAKDHWFSISAARRDLGYEPTVSTEEGMREYVAHTTGTGLPPG